MKPIAVMSSTLDPLHKLQRLAQDLRPYSSKNRHQQAIVGWQQDPLATLWLALLPVLLSWLWSCFAPLWHQPEPPTFPWFAAGHLLLQWLPLLLVQALVGWCWQQQLASTSTKKQLSWPLIGLLWLGLMVLYPLLLLWFELAVFNNTQWLLALSLSVLYWLHLFYQRSSVHNLKLRWLWSLDTLLLLGLLLWAVSWSLLLVSHPPGLAEQPIPVKLDQARLLAHPVLFVQYLLQLLCSAAVIFACYWLNRYYLMRKLLARHGLLPFVLVSLGLMLVSYAPLAALLLQLPMNQVAVPAVPAGNHNPFDIYNLNFMFLQWLLSTPLILAFERQQHERTLAQIQHQQVQTELQLLQQQINPHFLFNTLNNLYALCLTKADSAPELVLRLADLLRYVVYQGQQPRVTLAQELRYLEDYLALQQLRVSNKTEIHIDFPTQTSQWQLPPLLLIMLVENAFKHGIENTATASWLELNVSVNQQRLVFRCRNSHANGAALHSSNRGLGLVNLRRRLALHYGQQFVLQSQALADEWLAELQLELEPC